MATAGIAKAEEASAQSQKQVASLEAEDVRLRDEPRSIQAHRVVLAHPSRGLAVVI